MKIYIRLLLLFLVMGRSAFAQQTGLSGVVTDPQGAVIAGAKVEVKHLDGSSFFATTNAQGSFVFPALVAAEYKITVTAPGFSTSQKTLLLLVGQLAQVNMTLQIASATTSVEVVSGDVTAIDTTSSVVSGNVTPVEVQDVPINGRNYIQLSTLVAGIKANAFGNSPVSGPGGTSQGDAETGKFQITMDGLQVSQDSVGSSFGQPRFSQDAISQFQIITSRFDATSGRSAGIYVNAQTKSGSDGLHGGGFGYFRNSFFNAADPVLKLNKAAVTTPPFADEQYGGTMGGPIKKGKLWFFGSYEGEHSPQTATTAPLVTTTGGANYSHPNVLLLNEYLGRVDYQANEKNHLFLRGDYYSQKQSFVPSSVIGTDPSQSNINTVNATGYVFDWNRSINDHLINDVHAGFHYFQFETTPFFTTGSIVLNLPSATIGEPYNEPEIFDQYTQQYRDDVFWLKGKHSFKMGGEYLHTLHGGAFPQYLRGGLTACTPTAGIPAPNYNTFFPNGTLDPASWRYDLINAYCGGGETYIQAFGNYNISIARNIIGIWAQDDWKISSRLTLNLGIRYDNDIGAFNTSYVPSPGLLTPNTNPNLNFGPRLGFSYDPFADGKTSIRGGAGIYYADQVANAIIDEELYSSTARALQATISGTNLLLPTPFAGQNPSASPQYYSSSPQPVARGSKTPYAFQASFGVQRELGYKTTVAADMVYQRVYDDFTLLGANLLVNPANPEQNLNPSSNMSAAIYGSRVCGNGIIQLDTISNLATGSPNGTTPSGTPVTGPAKQVCNQAFGGTTREFTTYPGAGVIADALQVSIKHALANGFTGGIAYTWGKVKNSTNGQFSYPNKPFQPGIQQEWANGTDDQRQTLTVNGQYQWKYGLALSGLYHYGSGLAFAPSSGTTVNGYAGSTRTFAAGVTPIAFPSSGICPTGSVCVASPLSKISYDSGYGYSVIQRDGFRGSDYNRVDSRLQETIKIKERYHAIIAIEAFNLFNHTNFGSFSTNAIQGPITSTGAVNLNAYGHPLSVTGNPVEYQARSLQFIGRFSF
jgi:hypothetical protein